MESRFHLREKTVVLVGPMTPIVQSITLGLSQFGADVGILNSDIDRSQRFASQIMDSREVNSSFGRAFGIRTDFHDDDQVKESISKVAETFGGIETYIDTRTFFNMNLDSTVSSDRDLTEADVSKSRTAVTEEVLPFLKGRKKGRIIYLTHQPISGMDSADQLLEAETEMEKIVSEYGKKLTSFNVGINMLSVQLTEEYLLYHYAGKPIQEALDELHKTHPDLQLTEFDRITNSVLFFVSSLSSGITGQNIRIA